MRVLLVTNDYPPKPGGIQQYLGNIVARLEWPIRVLAPADDPSLDVGDVVRSSRRFMWPTPATRRWVNEQIAVFSPDVVVFGAPYPLAWLGRKMEVPVVVMTHGAEAVIPLAVPGLRGLVRASLKSADQLFAVSDFTARHVESSIGRAVSTLGAGVDLDAFSPVQVLKKGPLVVGCVSRFVPRKGQSRVIAAADQLHRSGVDCVVFLVGSGRLEKKLRRQAEAASVPVRFEVDVAWERLPSLYQEMSVFVMPSTSRWAGLEVEGLGIVYLEAAASGLPVIAGPSGGAPETVKVGETGFVASTATEIAEHLAWFSQDRERLASFGRASRRWAEDRWSWQTVIDRFEAGLRSAVDD